MLVAGAAYRHRLVSTVEPFARVAGGVTWLDLALHEGRRYTGDAMRPVAQAAVGLDLLVPRRAFQKDDGTSKHSFTIGLALEFGWTHVFSWQAELTPELPVGDGWQVRPVNLGDLRLSGYHTRIALAVRL
jgi:hypothetical protein